MTTARRELAPVIVVHVPRGGPNPWKVAALIDADAEEPTYEVQVSWPTAADARTTARARALLDPRQSPAAAIDAAHLARQRAFSTETFGPGARTAGVLDHIRRELEEVRADPSDVMEWADIAILALDGAMRAGHEPQAVIDAIIAKQARNEQRSWPDWQTADPDTAIEHDRSAEAAAASRADAATRAAAAAARASEVAARVRAVVAARQLRAGERESPDAP